MPNKTSKKKPAALPAIPKELIDQIAGGPMTAEAVNAATMAFKKALIERALGAELSHHLGYAPGTDKPEGAGNHRNGVSSKTVLTEDGPLRIDVPRDRQGRFEPLLIPKHERRFTGFAAALVAVTFNTIRLQILAQGAEIEVARLIGASDAWIRRPFSYFGALQGGLGGALACLLVIAGSALLSPAIGELAELYGAEFALRGPTAGFAAALIAGGAALGWLGAQCSVSISLRDA